MTAPTVRFPPARAMGDLKLSLPGLRGATAFVPDASAHQESCRLVYAGDAGITLYRDHRLVDVDLARSNGAPARADCYLVGMPHAADIFCTEEHIVENGRQLSPLASVTDLEPGALIGTSSSHCYECPWRSSCPALQFRLHFLATLAHNTPFSWAQLLLLPWTRISSFPHHSVWIPSFTTCATKQFCHATNLTPLRPSVHTAPLHLLCSND